MLNLFEDSEIRVHMIGSLYHFTDFRSSRTVLRYQNDQTAWDSVIVPGAHVSMGILHDDVHGVEECDCCKVKSSNMTIIDPSEYLV